MPPFLPEFVGLVVAASLGAYLAFRAGLVPIVGFLVAGVIVGPSALGLVTDPTVIGAAAEIGVLLLLFTLGIEFSVERLARSLRLVAVGGGLQVVGTVALVTGVLALAGVDWRTGVFTGFLVAMSSTALILKTLNARGRAGSPEGDAAVGVSLGQDLASIAMVLLIPALGTGGGAAGLGGALLRAVLLVAVALVVARRLMPPVLEAIARTCSQELFLLSVMAIALGTAYVAGLAGVSLSLGAFLAGVVVSESRLSSHALGEVMPLQVLFLAAFFVSVGLLLDVAFVLANAGWIALAVAAVIVLKAAVAIPAVRLAGLPAGAAVGGGVLLAQVGEFSFVLEAAGRAAGLSPLGLGEPGRQGFIATVVVAMALVPSLLGPAERLAGRFGRRRVTPSPLSTAEAPAAALVLVAGYASSARALVPALVAAGHRPSVLTLNPEGATEAAAAGAEVLLGDPSREAALVGAGLDRAAVVVVPDSAPAEAARTLAVVRARRADVPVVAPAETAPEADALRAVGASVVVVREDAARDALRAATLDALSAATAGRAPVGLAPTTAPRCAHAAEARPVVPRADGCEECLAADTSWVHLRVCLACGHVGCCDSSPGRHATAHYHATGHPVVRSLEPGETWGWCYVDEVEV